MIRLTALRLFRLLVIFFAGWLLMIAVRHSPTATDVPLDAVRSFFPDARHLVANKDKLRSFRVIAKDGVTLGHVLTTSPEMDGLVGYAGPSNLLLALDLQGKLLGVQLLSSADTISHVDAVRASNSFWKSFTGWQPNAEPFPKIEAVGGSTLTSLAMTEAVERRLTEKTVSRRFPQSLSLNEVQSLFPQAVTFKADDPRQGWFRAGDANGVTLGFVLRTAPYADNIRGYRGPTESLMAISPDGKKVLKAKLWKSYDTPEYVDRVKEDSDYLALLANRTLEDWRKLDFAKAGIEGVSGATQTSYAVADGIRKRLIADELLARADSGSWRKTIRTFGLLGMVLGALWMAFGPLRTMRRARMGWQILLILVFGILLGDLLSLSLFAGWARHGIPWQTAPALVFLACVALFIPWVSRKNLYCQHLCPHGAAQELLGKFRTLHLPMAPAIQRPMRGIPTVILLVALVLGIVFVEFDLARLEPFDAWILRGAAVVSAIIAVVGLLASLFVPMAYCRFGCATGSILNFLRTGGSSDRFGTKDVVACALLGVGVLATFANMHRTGLIAEIANKSDRQESTMFQGKAFGSTWSVKLRVKIPSAESLQAKLQKELHRIEGLLSHWKPQSATAQFNASKTTLETEQPAELISLVAKAIEISRATRGRYDITVAPLVQAWGYGPGGEPTKPPTNDEIASLLERTGWQKLVVDSGEKTLRKLHPDLQLDLGSILQGYAADRLGTILDEEFENSPKDYLIEVGGELLARGEWTVAIENPLQQGEPLRTLTLKNAALATSGIHRSAKKLEGRKVNHFISPTTGRPVENDLQQVSVLAPRCVDADAWATALFVSGMPVALQLADEIGFTAWCQDSKGQLHTNQR